VTTEQTTSSAEEIKEQVRQTYGRLASRFVEAPSRASCCSPARETSRSDKAQATEPCCTPAQETSCCGDTQATEPCCGPAPESCCGPAPEACCTPTLEACCTPTLESCCGPTQETSGCDPVQAAEASGKHHLYSEDELGDLPESVTQASAGCGNPTAIASLEPGEVVLDLGSGGGIDCFLATKKVGPSGQVIGLDMTPEMIRLARRNARKMGVANVDFRWGEMEEMPISDASVDVIISNCVINLSPDKDAVFSETYRVLKPGGRLSVSDIVVDGDLPAPLRRSLDAWAGCVAGALDEAVYLDKMRAAGLTDIEVTQRRTIDVSSWVDAEEIQALLAQADPPMSAGELWEQARDKVASVTVTARKSA
jgi:SAM-dependent methyltransferase